MMDRFLQTILAHRLPPRPWQEGEKIPWDEPEFSRRMLREHLSQSHDAASRRFEIIENHIDWIQREVLRGSPARILDLCCGPGLYGSRFARLGHSYTGIDFSPASIAYARETAAQQDLPCTYEQGDVRQAEFGNGYDLVMCIFGEFNTFQRSDAARILAKAHQSLKPGGKLLLEPHTLEAVKKVGFSGRKWYAAESGLWSDSAFLYLQECFWDEVEQAATTRYFIFESEPPGVRQLSASMQGYSRQGYESLLGEANFSGVEIRDGFSSRPCDPAAEFYVVLAQAGV